MAKVLVPALLLAALAWSAPLAHAADHDPHEHDHDPPSAAVACQTAMTEVGLGDLDQAKAILSALPHPPEDPCVPLVWTKLDEQRLTAVEQVEAGQTRLRAGDLPGAKAHFLQARAIDQGNQEAAAGLTQLARLEGHALPTARSNWEYVYDDWLSPIGRFLLPAVVGVLVLLLASSLLARLLVRPASVAWPKAQRWTINIMGAVLILGASVLLPVYPMFHPFGLGRPLLWVGVGAILLIPVAVVIIIDWAARFLDAHGVPKEGVWKDWRRLLGALVAVPLVALALWYTCMTRLTSHLLLAFLVLAAFGVILSAAGLGQNLRLQIAAQNGSGQSDAASTDYLLARMVTLGSENPEGLEVGIPQTSFSSLQSETLSVLPTNTAVSFLTRLFYTLRPDLTWQARVTMVDCNRLSVTLTRNGRRADSTIFSRLDLDLPPLDGSPAAQDRGRAQLLTGAAAFILVQLGRVHRPLLDGLSGARNWKSVTLQVIAASRSLIDHPAKQAELLAGAVNEDPGNLAARFDYLWAAFRQYPPAERDHADFARAVLYCMCGTEQQQRVLAEAPALRLRVLHTLATQLVNGYLQGDRTDQQALIQAACLARALRLACEPDRPDSPDHEWQAAQLLPFAENLVEATDVLLGHPNRPPHSHQAKSYSPRLSWDNACVDACWSLETGDGSRNSEAVQDLWFALASRRRRRAAGEDPCFRPLLQEAGFRQARRLPRGRLLDLPDFDSVRAELTDLGLTGPAALADATSPAKRWTLINQLRPGHPQVTQATVVAWHDLATLAGLHDALNDRDLLELLAELGPVSKTWWQEEIQRDRQDLIRRLRTAAKTRRLDRIPGVVNPLPWMDAVARAV